MATYSLRINGKTHQVEGEPDDSLLSVLRYDLGLIGSKFGCGEGFCGACTVLADNQMTRSCVMRLGAVGNAAITTIEGLAVNDRLSISFGYDHSNFARTKQRVENVGTGLVSVIRQQPVTVGSYLVGGSYAVNDRVRINLNTSFGATDEAPDMRVSLRAQVRLFE